MVQPLLYYTTSMMLLFVGFRSGIVRVWFGKRVKQGQTNCRLYNDHFRTVLQYGNSDADRGQPGNNPITPLICTQIILHEISCVDRIAGSDRSLFCPI
jgi:hypothetical protein